MADKTVNYTFEQTQNIIAAYKAGTPVSDIASAMGKSARSIIAKLSREGVYQKKEYTSKTGEKPVKKDVQADKIAALCNLTEAEADSLTKANKTALAKILDKLAVLA